MTTNSSDQPPGTGATPAHSGASDNSGGRFEIHYQMRDRGVAIIQLGGRMDGKAVHALGQTIKDMFRQDHFRLIFDCSAMTYITSGGVGAIVSAITEAQANGGDIVLIQPSPNVKHVIALLGLNELIPVSASLKDALATFNWWPHEKQS